MEYVNFGGTGRRVSRMCLGTMMFGGKTDEAEAERIVLTSIDRGVDFLDTAATDADGATEEILGRILKHRGAQRDRLFLCTKVTRTTDADWIRQSMDESLARLQVDYVDLFLIHWPRPNMDIEVIMGTLNQLAVSGKARHVGCSSLRQVETTIGAFDFDLSPEHYAQINALFHGDAPEKPASQMSQEEWRDYPRLRRSFDLVTA